jgi:hypothetical protein
MSELEQAFWADVNDCTVCQSKPLSELCEKHQQELENIVQLEERDPDAPKKDPF